MKADAAVLYSINPVTGRFLSGPNTRGLLHPSSRDELRAPRDTGLTSAVLQRGLLLVPDLAKDPSWHSPFAEAEGIQAFAALSLLEPRTGEPLAVLYVDYRTARTFTEEHEAQLAAFAAEASSLLQTTWLLVRYRELARIGHEINQGLESSQGLFQNLITHLPGILDLGSFMGLGVYRPHDDRFLIHYRWLDQVAACEDCSLQEPWKSLLMAGEISVEAGPGPLVASLSPDAPPLKSQLFLPLHLRGNPLGFLSVQHERENVYDAEDLHLLELLANHLSAALSGIRLFRDLDQLTEAGRKLAESIDDRGHLQQITEILREATGADPVVLYPFLEKQSKLWLPVVSGTLLQKEFPRLALDAEGGSRDTLPYRVMELGEALFLGDAAEIRPQLGLPPRAAGVKTFRETEEIASLVAAPILANREKIGVLLLNFRQQQTFDGPRKRLIRSLISFAAIAMRNARRFGGLGLQRAEELEALQTIDRALSSSSHTPDRLLQEILEIANRVVGADDASILLMEPVARDEAPLSSRLHEPGAQKLFVVSAIGPSAAATIGWTSLQSKSSLVANVMQFKRSVRVEDIDTDPRWGPIYHRLRPNTVAELDVPILVDKKTLIGVLNFESDRPGAFTPETQRFVETLANQVAIAVQRVRAVELAKKESEDRLVLMELSRIIIGELELDKLLEVILDKAMQTAKAQAGVIMLYDEEREDLVAQVDQGLDRDYRGHRIPRSKGIVGLVAREQQIKNIDPTEPQWQGIYLDYVPATRSLLALPMLEGKRLWGVINIESPKENCFDDRVERLMESLANFAVIALGNAERYAEAKKFGARLDAISSVIFHIAQNQNFLEVAQAIVAAALQLTGKSSLRSDLVLFEKGEPRRVYSVERSGASAGEGVWRDLRRGEGYPGLQGIIGQVARTGKSYRTRWDAQTDRYFRESPLIDSEIHSELAVPLNDNGKLVGVLNVESRELLDFDASDEELLGLFAGEVVIALQNVQHLDQAEARLGRFMTLLEASEKLARLSDARELRTACQIAADLAAATCKCQAVVRALDSSSKDLVLVARAGGGPGEQLFHRIPIDETSLNGLVARDRERRRIPDLENPGPNPVQVKPADTRTRDIAVLPIGFQDTYFGNFGVSHHEPHHFEDVDFDLFRGLAQLIALTQQRMESRARENGLREKERQTQILRWMGDASYGIAHRLGNDLGHTHFELDKVTQRLKKLKIRDTVIESSCAQIGRSVANVLAMKERLASEVRTLKLGEPTVLKVREVLADVAEQFRGVLPRQINLVLDVELDIGRLLAIPGHVNDILFNLINNAVEAMTRSKKFGEIRLKARNKSTDIAIEIIDQGPGIEAARLESIFDFLVSGSEQRSRQKNAGTGFGLWSGRQKAMRNGGTLEVKSDLGKGAIFILTLPRFEPPLETQFEDLPSGQSTAISPEKSMG